jgi:dolichol-phosphate mannosyltransferase
MKKKLSIVIPYFNGDESLVELCNQLKYFIEREKIRTEVLFIFDGPEAGSWDFFYAITQKNGFKALRLIKNVGQHAAIRAGLTISSGDYVAILDCDLQDPPEAIHDLLKKMTDKFDVVYGVRNGNYDGLIRKSLRKGANLFLKAIYPKDFNLDVGSFMLLRKNVVDEILKIQRNNQLGLLVYSFGFPSQTHIYERKRRQYGRSSYSTKKLLNHGIQALDFDLSHFFRLSISFSIIFATGSAISGVIILIRALFANYRSGWASLFVMSSLGFSLSLILLSLIGYSISQSHNDKSRPIFILDERNN